MGRQMFNTGEEPWGEEPPFHMPVFVLTHKRTPKIVKEGGTKSYAEAMKRLPTPSRTLDIPTDYGTVRVYVAMAANSSLHNSAKAVEVAQANIEHVQAKNWPGATHSLPMEFPKEIDAEILAFMDACDYSK
jgi:hypothetical protein